jgi:hypothetical protein
MNWNVVYLKESIWPLIRKQLPGFSLNITDISFKKVMQLHNVGWLLVRTVDANVASEVLQNARVVLAPYGLGLELRQVVESMQWGTPDNYDF